MHELPLCEAVLDQVCARSGDTPVRRVSVAVGAAHHATPDAFQQLFTQAAVGTVAADAEIDLSIVPAMFSCSCGASGAADARIPLCPSCDEPVRPTGGDALEITAIEWVVVDMCLAVPGQIIELDPESDVAVADLQGVRRRINIALVEEDGIAVGDWVLIHVGFAMTKIDEAEARESLELMTELFGAT